jgi:hypothetical protein
MYKDCPPGPGEYLAIKTGLKKYKSPLSIRSHFTPCHTKGKDGQPINKLSTEAITGQLAPPTSILPVVSTITTVEVLNWKCTCPLQSLHFANSIKRVRKSMAKGEKRSEVSW